MRKFEKILEEIEKAKREPWYRLNNHDVKHKLDGAINRIVEIIRKNMSGKDTNVPTNNGWIPVEERLPEEHEVYNYAFDPANVSNIDIDRSMESDSVQITVYDPCKNVYFVCHDYTVDGRWSKFEDTTGYFRVIAWRPLPDPYRPERRAQNGNQ